MGRTIRRIRIWWRRRVPVPLLLIGTAVVLVLFLNEETSLNRNYRYQQEIVRLQREIKLNNDSAAYYRAKRRALSTSAAELEHIAREQYHMQRPDEEVFIIQQ